MKIQTRSKLLEAQIKLDHLESLLHNLPAKPILYVLISVYVDGYLIIYRLIELKLNN